MLIVSCQRRRVLVASQDSNGECIDPAGEQPVHPGVPQRVQRAPSRRFEGSLVREPIACFVQQASIRPWLATANSPFIFAAYSLTSRSSTYTNFPPLSFASTFDARSFLPILIRIRANAQFTLSAVHGPLANS